MPELPPPPPYRPGPAPLPPFRSAQQSSNKVLWIVLGCVAVAFLLGLLLVAGLLFAAFRTTGTQQATPAATTATAIYSDPSESGAFALGRDYLAAIQRRDRVLASAMFCDHRSVDYSSVPADQKFTTISVRSTGQGSAVARLQSTIGTVPTTNIIDLAYRGGTWCVVD